MNIREQRKWQHLQYSLSTKKGPLDPGFNNVHLIHQALPTFGLEDIDTSLELFGKRLKFPLLINAMTGGASGLEKYNRIFALAASECGLAMAVGSQMAALKNPATKESFTIARQYNPQGILLANISALAKPKEALAVVEMIEADALQLHLNLAQELVMTEGDRHFGGLLENILLIREQCPVPVIIKEVGFGLSLETVTKLYEHGLDCFDIGGAGGTNFAAIEDQRNHQNTNSNLISWGIPTVISLLETKNAVNEGLIFATGGIRQAQDIIISLILGATLVGMAKPFLELTQDFDELKIINYCHRLIQEVKELMLLINSINLAELTMVPIVITGFVQQWIEQRNLKLGPR